MELTVRFLLAFLLGAALLVVVSFTIYRKSYHYQKARAESTGSTERPRKAGLIVSGAIFLGMIGFLVLFDFWIAPHSGREFALLVAFNLVLVLLLSAFDAFFIDSFMLVVWRPPILRLPQGLPTAESMKRHVALQFSRGWIFKVPMAVSAAAVASLLLGSPPR